MSLRARLGVGRTQTKQMRHYVFHSVAVERACLHTELHRAQMHTDVVEDTPANHNTQKFLLKGDT